MLRRNIKKFTSKTTHFLDIKPCSNFPLSQRVRRMDLPNIATLPTQVYIPTSRNNIPNTLLLFINKHYLKPKLLPWSHPSLNQSLNNWDYVIIKLFNGSFNRYYKTANNLTLLDGLRPWLEE